MLKFPGQFRARCSNLRFVVETLLVYFPQYILHIPGAIGKFTIIATDLHLLVSK